MNERIKELDKQAKLWAMDNTNFPISSHIPAGYTEKFAELIALECAELMEKQHSWITNIAASKLIRQHFGVEE
jgi:hypothetical protein